jgi:hypothetical protein
LLRVTALFTVVTTLLRPRLSRRPFVPVISRRACATGAASLAMWMAVQVPADATELRTFAGAPYSHEGVTPKVMPRGDGAPAPETQEAGWIPLLVLGGSLLAIGAAGFVLHGRRQTA